MAICDMCKKNKHSFRPLTIDTLSGYFCDECQIEIAEFINKKAYKNKKVKKYRVIMDSLCCYKVGDIIIKNQYNQYILIEFSMDKQSDNDIYLPASVVENTPEWFEEITEEEKVCPICKKLDIKYMGMLYEKPVYKCKVCNILLSIED